MSQTTGLTTVHEDDIAKHRDTAQGMVTRMVIVQRAFDAAMRSIQAEDQASSRFLQEL